jgi:hypothetical protein
LFILDLYSFECIIMTPEQITVLRTALIADNDPAVIASKVARNDTETARLYNLPSTFIVWKTQVPVQDIFDCIIWANMTPASVPDTTTIWGNRNLQCQSKQFNLQTMLGGRDSINAAKANIRTGLQDALTALPSKADGTNQAAGWTTVLALMKRAASKCETLYVTGTGTSATPGNVGTVEGDVSVSDIAEALNGV